MARTLEQLKEENAKAEAESTSTPQTDEDETKAGAVEAETDTSTGAEAGTGEDVKTEIEPWMQSGEEESDADGHASDDKQFSGKDIAAAKRNLRAKLEKRQTAKDEQYEARIAALEKQVESGTTTHQPAQPVAGAVAKPVRDNYETDEAFIEALTDWKLATNAASQHAESQKTANRRKVEEYEQQTEQAVDQHYERAVKLAEKSSITSEAYQAADLRVREMIEGVFPKAGDAITDNLIATLGEGSERVMYNLGVNEKRRNHLRDLLGADTTGLKAATYLGQLNAELSSPAKKRTSAPAPADDVTGDTTKTKSFKNEKRRYQDAHKRGDGQAAFNIRREARQAGADTSDW